MTARRRRPSNAPRPELARKDPPARKVTPAAPSSSPYAGTGIPDWKWRTTPVLLMFALGGLIGAFGGAAAAPNQLAFLIIMGTFAMLFGLSAGRVIRRWLAIRKIEKMRAG